MSDTDENSDYATAKAEEARAQAEARRKRILEKAHKRMGVVSGEQAQDEEEKQVSVSNAARIRAARQRRYGKKSATPSTTTSEPSPVDGTKTESTTNAAIDPSTATTETGVSDSKTSTMETPTADVVSEPVTITATEKSRLSKDSDTTTSDTKTTKATTASSSEKNKKYMGVAKMRRKMIAKKKLEEDEKEQTATTTSTTSGSAAESDPVTSKAMTAPKIARFPIYMHVVIIMLLFLAGLDVGIQQFHDDVIVHGDTAIHEYGLPFVQRSPWKIVAPKSENDAKRTLEEELLSSNQGVKPKGADTANEEFVDESGSDDDEYIPNIDPLFRVDLDELTKGPGIFNQLARGAIAVHRMILWMIYYTPINLVNTLIAIPSALMKMPPALFLIALILRQIVGKMVLGAHIPDPTPDSPEERNNIEVISMATNFVKNFFSTNFPTLVWAYDVFVHLRSDMYIVLCGVFCGMAWSHLTVRPSVLDGSEDSFPVDGMADEL